MIEWRQGAEMRHVFFDETYPDASGGRKNIVMAAWTVEQSRFDQCFSTDTSLQKWPGVDGINSVLEKLDADALVGWISLDEQLFRAGEIDGTDDIPAMRRKNNILSVYAAFVIASLIAKLLSEKKDIGKLDIHPDPKSLGQQHLRVVEEFLRKNVVSTAKGFASHLGLSSTIQIGRIGFIAKARGANARDKFQTGVWVADRLCSSYKPIASGGFSRIAAKDMSEVVRRTVQQFDGKPYHA
jgi:hypothetical protein